MVLADGRYDLSMNGPVAVLIFFGLWRNAIGFPDVDELAFVHLELHESN